MKIFNWVVVVAFIGFLIFLALGRRGQVANVSDIKHVSFGGTSVQVELALTEEAKRHGLSDRESLDPDTGMLFVFDYSTRHPFWMKDMNFPIDMIWLDERGTIVYIEHNASPESYPSLFGSNIESKYVLEVVAGFAEKHGLQIGDQAKFTN